MHSKCRPNDMPSSITASSDIVAVVPSTATPPQGSLLQATPLGDLKQRSVRGGLVAILAQGMTFVLQTGSTIALARLLSPSDFGLQGMVVAMTGFLSLFRDAGLSVATVQRDHLT